MQDFLTAIGLVFVIEGLVYAAFPDGIKKMMAEMQKIPSQKLQQAGFIVASFGIAFLWLMR